MPNPALDNSSFLNYTLTMVLSEFSPEFFIKGLDPEKEKLFYFYCSKLYTSIFGLLLYHLQCLILVNIGKYQQLSIQREHRSQTCLGNVTKEMKVESIMLFFFFLHIQKVKCSENMLYDWKMLINSHEVVMGAREHSTVQQSMTGLTMFSQGEDLSRATAKTGICEQKSGMLVPVRPYKVTELMQELRVGRRSNVEMRGSIHGS